MSLNISIADGMNLALMTQRWLTSMNRLYYQPRIQSITRPILLC